jgi:hypothetical protein
MTATRNNRFIINNMTHYNTDDLLSMMNEVVLRDEQRIAADRAASLWGAEPPTGTVIEFHEFNGNDRWDNKRRWTASGVEIDRKRVYVMDKDSREWHVIKIVPPSRLYPDQLEALCADMTKAPAALVEQLAHRMARLVSADFPWTTNPETGGQIPTVMLGKTLRVESEKQGKRKAANKRPALLHDLRESQRNNYHRLDSGVSSIGYALRAIAGLEKKREELGLPSLQENVEQMLALHEEVRNKTEQVRLILEQTPTA